MAIYQTVITASLPPLQQKKSQLYIFDQSSKPFKKSSLRSVLIHLNSDPIRMFYW